MDRGFATRSASAAGSNAGGKSEGVAAVGSGGLGVARSLGVVEKSCRVFDKNYYDGIAEFWCYRKNWNWWLIHMRVLFGAQDILDLVNDGYTPVAENEIEVQRYMQRETRKNDQKVLLYIHHCMDMKVFEKIVYSTKAKWVTLVWCYGGDTSVKNIKLQSLYKKYENLSMKNNEKVPDYISKVIVLTNEMKSCGATLFEQKSELSNSDEKKHKNVHKGKEKFDKRKVQCYSCNKFGHFVDDCWSNKDSKGEEAIISIGDFDDEPMLLMESENVSVTMVDWWYMDIGCSNHLTRNKQWMVDFDSGRKTNIRCVDDEYLNTEGLGNVRVKLNNGKNVLIKDVWYVRGMKIKLMGIDQPIEKGFSVTMKDNILKLYDCNQNLIMQYKLGRNGIFKVNVAT
ncbi:uncharacterized protein LOC127104322 [Lathyrus oleraceus]|uniref:uncharacterized protein LOC127104322 n=1 Tax=Pisum sativum TaxID=3888 RepID=UPI0021D1A809|nr:uncharacterized protein LOC127104322 [Pisum sativum]